MTQPDLSDAAAHYWSIDIPGLQEEEAMEVVEWARREGHGIDAIPADPRLFLTLHLPREAVEYLARLLAKRREILGLSLDAYDDDSALLEDFTDWLDWSHRHRDVDADVESRE
jgi:hypothetical protein